MLVVIRWLELRRKNDDSRRARAGMAALNRSCDSAGNAASDGGQEQRETGSVGDEARHQQTYPSKENERSLEHVTASRNTGPYA